MSRTVIGFDYGTKRIGVAAGQELTHTAQAIAVVRNDEKEGPWSAIEKLIGEWLPGLLVVGLPFGADGAESEMCKAARAFGDGLSERFRIPVEFVDETLTSRAAEEMIKASIPVGKRTERKRQSLKDSVAAELILQTYLHERGARTHAR